MWRKNYLGIQFDLEILKKNVSSLANGLIELIDFELSDTIVVYRHSTDDVPLINILNKEDFDIDNQNR